VTLTPQEGGEVLVLDCTCLSHFARADRLDVLQGLLAADESWTTQVVLRELRDGYAEYPLLELVEEGNWLKIAEFGTPAEISLFAEWSLRIGADDRDFGEASVFAAAELRGGIAITDDRRAVAVARARCLRVHGTIWLLARACRKEEISEHGAGSLIDALRGTGHRLPCTGAEFPEFARRYRLL
jgi:predicted nucleic acid-binding protein